MAQSNPLQWLMTTVLLFSNTVFASELGKFVLVLDDLGNQRASGIEAINIPWVTTVAIMPARPYSQELAEFAQQMGKEIIIHAPMSNSIDFPLGALGLDRSDGRQQLQENIRLAIENLPQAVGLSNHMGSRLTQDPEAMAWVMQVLARYGLYFFDSKTVASSIAWQVAAERRIPWAKRDVFLDHEQTSAFMAKQWAYAEKLWRTGVDVTVICHPYPQTLAFLKQLQLSQTLQSHLAPLSAVLHYPKIIERESRNIPQGI